MSYNIPTLYGYKIDNNLSDVINKRIALLRLNIDIDDLEVIRGVASDAGATRDDMIAVTGLESPLYSTLFRFDGETIEYRNILEKVAGVDGTLRGDMFVNGPIGGSAIRYTFTDFTLKLNFTSVSGGVLVQNERIADSTDPTTNGIIRTVGSNFVIIEKVNGGPFLNGRTFVGSFGGASFVVTSTENTTELKFADISTSRVSAWSTFSAAIPSAADPIFYGNQLKIRTGGKITVDKITWGVNAVSRIRNPATNLFITGEIPTHTITVNINNQNIKLYAMKSIPLKFRGFFKRFDASLQFNSAAPNTRVSWRVVNVNNPTDAQLYAELGSTSSSSLSYRNILGAERDIEIYYHPNFIRTLSLQSIGLRELPSTSLPSLETISVYNNTIKDIPDFKKFSPGLKTLNIGMNSLYLADTVALRKFSPEVVDRLPSTLTSLSMQSTFLGTIRCVDNSGALITTEIGGAASYSIIEKAFPNLISLDLSRASSIGFAPDDYDTLCYLPTLPEFIETASFVNNDFRRIPARGFKDRTTLKQLYLSSNVNLTDETFSIASNVIQAVDIGSTNLPIPDMSLKTSLTSFGATYNRNTGTLYSNTASDSGFKFNGCSAVTSIGLYGANVTGFIPKFKGNAALRTIDWRYTNLSGGRPDNGEHGYADGKTYVMYNDTFDANRQIVTEFRVVSSSLLQGRGFEENTFTGMSALRVLQWESYNNTGLGSTTIAIPDISTCAALTDLIMPSNNFTGPVPSMATNPSISTINLRYNRLTGAVPTFTNRRSLTSVLLSANSLSSFTGFDSTPALSTVFIENNQITGEIPLLGDPTRSPNISTLYMNNNQFSSYAIGSFARLTRLRTLDLSSNSLDRFAINNIIKDLYDNYTRAKRRGVSINLRSQANAVGYVPSLAGSPSEKEAAEIITFLRSVGWTIIVG